MAGFSLLRSDERRDGLLEGRVRDELVEFVQLVLPTGQDVNFDLNVTAVAEEEGNGDPDSASVTASIWSS